MTFRPASWLASPHLCAAEQAVIAARAAEDVEAALPEQVVLPRAAEHQVVRAVAREADRAVHLWRQRHGHVHAGADACQGGNGSDAAAESAEDAYGSIETMLTLTA